jgi:hypothetical protein
MKPIIVGKTREGNTVAYCSLFKWKDQEGLPIDIAANHLQKKGITPSWLCEVEGALWMGMPEDQIISELKEVFTMLYPGKSKSLIKRVINYMQYRRKPNPFTIQAIKLTKP